MSRKNMNLVIVCAIVGFLHFIEASIEPNSKNTKNFDNILLKSGRRAVESEYVFQVSIEDQNGTMVNYCSGVILSRHWTLSAAHCLNNLSDSPNTLYIKAGINKKNVLAGNVQRRGVKKILYPPDYSITGREGIDNDIALLKLEQPLIFSTTVGAINLYSNSTLLNTPGYEVIGWGATNEYDTDSKDVLFMSPVSFDKINECKRYINVFTEKFCHGGSLILRKNHAYWIVGLSSYGSHYCDPSKPIAFTKLSIHVEWIKKINSELL